MSRSPTPQQLAVLISTALQGLAPACAAGRVHPLLRGGGLSPLCGTHDHCEQHGEAVSGSRLRPPGRLSGHTARIGWLGWQFVDMER